MAPFRNRDRSNRSGRGQVEHNVLEGLPINQYREVEITIGPNSLETKQVDKNAWPEPPMPRDSHMLPEHSQQILRAARAGRIHKPPAPPEEDKDPLDEEDEHKEVPQGFMVKKWAKVPRHLEEAEPEYLAKRRKGLPSQYAQSTQISAQPTPMRETKVKKTDSEGNVNVYKVLVPEGQAVEGEVAPTDAISEAAPITAAPGTVVEGVGVVNAEGVVVANDVMQQTPPRRRPPPPKKKKKSGPGRGKKKVVFIEGQAEQGTPASGTGSDLLAVPGVKQEEGSVEPSEGGDTPMPDAGDEEEGSGEEGSDDEEHDEGSHSPTPAQSVPASETPAELSNAPKTEPLKEPVVEAPPPVLEAAPTAEPPVPESVEYTDPAPTQSVVPAPIDTQLEPEKDKDGRDLSSSPELPLSAMAHSRQNSLNQIPIIPPLEAPAPEPETEPVPVVEPVPVAEPVPELVSAPEVEPEAELAPEPAPERSPEPIVTEAPEPVPEHTTEPVIAAEVPPAPEVLPAPESATAVETVPTPPSAQSLAQGLATDEVPQAPEVQASDGEPDLLGDLERHLEKDSESMAAP